MSHSFHSSVMPASGSPKPLDQYPEEPRNEAALADWEGEGGRAVVAPPEITAIDAMVSLLCAACRSDEDVRFRDDDHLRDFGFCDACLDRARMAFTDEELGGEA